MAPVMQGLSQTDLQGCDDIFFCKQGKLMLPGVAEATRTADSGLVIPQGNEDEDGDEEDLPPEVLEALENDLLAGRPAISQKELLQHEDEEGSTEDDEEDEEDISLDVLEALERDLLASRPPSEFSYYWLAQWAPDLMLRVSQFFTWKQFVRLSVLCRSLKMLELQESSWQLFFQMAWPRLAKRRLVTKDVPWRALFQAQWLYGGCEGDEHEENWLDCNAAHNLQLKIKEPERRHQTMLVAKRKAAELQQCIYACSMALKDKGIHVPAEADPDHICDKRCKFHRLMEHASDVSDDCFLCETSGALHQCLEGIPCRHCVISADGCFDICIVSGRCFPRENMVHVEDERDPEPTYTWDPDLSEAQQVGRWFEQGYHMSEEDASDFFGDTSRNRKRRRKLPGLSGWWY